MITKKLFQLSVLTLLFFFSNQLESYDCLNPFLIEGKAAYYYPTSHTFRRIYSENGIYGGEISCQTYNNLYTWASVDGYSKKGRSIGLQDATKLTFIPVGLGLKYFFPISCFNCFVGAGLLGTYARLKDRFNLSSTNLTFTHRQSKGNVGGIVKVGLLYTINNNWYLDLFSNYSYTKISFFNKYLGTIQRRQANLSGWSIGLGIGYSFQCFR